MEHYEIATYGSLHQLAITFGKKYIAELLEQTLGEENQADSLLTVIAQKHVNYATLEELVS